MFADRTDELCSLLLSARDSQFRIVIESLQKHRSDAVAILNAPIITIEELRPNVQTDEPVVAKTANRVLGLIALGAGDELWPLWDVASDPRLQTYLVHGYYLKRLPPDLLSQQLRSRADPQAGVQYALLLSLGGFAPADLTESERVKLLAWLLDRYQAHPDSGVHSGIRWLLKRWGAIDKIAEADTKLIAHGFNEKRDWYLNSLGQTMVVIRPETSSPATTSGNRANRRSGTKLAPFVIAATGTTWKEYVILLPDSERMPGVVDDEPVRGLSWFDTAEFCRRLSEREEMGSQCDSIIVANRQLEETAEIDLMRTGYRPPTQHEWEYAARAGSRTARFFGTTQTPYAPAYLWHSKLEDRAAVVAGLCPNAFGLFDVYGNVREWTSTPFGHESIAAATNDSTGGRLSIGHLTNLGHCGGDFTTLLSEYKSTTCDPIHAGRPLGFNFNGFGIRIARTLP